MRNLFGWIVGGIFIIFCIQSCTFFEPTNWSTDIPNIGSSSSPHAIDLNKDGIKDIVVGGGTKEFVATDHGVVAINGLDGSILWNVPARNQIVGSPVFSDITGDSIPDVFIGGRSAVLFGINGSNGEIIWEFRPDDETTDYINDTSILNFYNPQIIPDQDHDGVADLLIAYGGYIKAPAYQKERPVGYLMVVSAKSGKEIIRDDVADGKETYMSPIVYDISGNGELDIIYGTGGEQINGSLYRTTLKDLMAGNLHNSQKLSDGQGKGFISPPVIVDVNQDGTKDIVVNSVDGRMMSFDGKTNRQIWESTLGKSYDVYTMPAPGYFVGDDDIIDFFATFGYGSWPQTKYSVNILVNGKTGEIEYQDTLGIFQYASPVVFDISGDGVEDIVLAINQIMVKELVGGTLQLFGSEIKVYDMKNRKVSTYNAPKLGCNLGSTPLITDLDGNGYMDMIYCYMSDANNFYSFKNLKVERMESPLQIQSEILWGEYMGKNYNGVYE